FGPVLEQGSAHDVHLPELHGPVPLPPAVLIPALAPPPELDQAVALQAPVDRGAGRDRAHAGPPQMVLDAAGPPPRVLPAELADHGLDLGIGLMGAAPRAVRPIGQGGQASSLVAGHPGVDALARHAE